MYRYILHVLYFFRLYICINIYLCILHICRFLSSFKFVRLQNCLKVKFTFKNLPYIYSTTYIIFQLSNILYVYILYITCIMLESWKTLLIRTKSQNKPIYMPQGMQFNGLFRIA